MIPLSLHIEGLYSYQQKQTIDFEKLTSNGLFGIFGEVGSGKSSILEAIMFVLFDDTERLNKSGDDRYYNMLNLQSNRFSIDFTFLAGKGNKEKYRFACTAKRSNNPDKFEDVKIAKHDRQFYKWDNTQWMPLEEVKDATEILGMDYKHFKQTIIIPQGKFREFFDQTSGDRTRMLKELFRLHSFDLGPQTGRLQKENELKIQHVEGQLESLGESQPEVLEQLSEEIEGLKASILKLEQQLVLDRKKEQELQNLQKLHQQLSECRKQLQQLEGQKASWDERARRLKTYGEAYTHFYEKLRQQEATSGELQQKQAQKEQLSQQLKQQLDQQQQAKTAFEQAKKAYEQKEQIQRKIEDLERIIQIKATEDKLEATRTKQQKLETSCRQEENNSRKAKESWQQLEERVQKLEAGQADISRLSDAYQWVERKEELQNQLRKAENSLAECREELSAGREQRQKVLQEWPTLLNATEWPVLFSGLEEIRQKLAAEETAEQKKLAELHVQQKLSEYADKLETGQACPICGATDHPQLAISKHIAESCQKQEQKIGKIKKQQEKVNELNAQLKELQTDLRHFEQNLRQQQSNAKELQEQLQEHEAAYAWPEYAQTPKFELKRQIDLTRLAHEQIKRVKSELLAAKKEAEEKTLRFEAQQKELQQLERSLSEQEGILKARKEALHADNHSWLKHDLQLLEENLSKGKVKLEQLISQFDKSQQQLNQLNEAVSGLTARSETATQAVEELQQKLKKQQEEIQALCSSKGFKNTDEVKTILALKLDMEQEEKQLNDYRQQLHSTAEHLKKLEQQANGQTYQAEEHEALKQQIKGAEQQCEEQKSRRTKFEHQKAELEKRLARSKELQKELKQLELRKENLKELSGLFRGNGFVDYVSTIYLQDLCRVANERFFKLTRNNLSLELNAQNNFIVRDYLNGGRTRLAKTLSGGQTFQAALCLALALAENIKSLNEAEQSFFFLDEGFGSLDKENLRIVFDTLKSLRQENRIVGIISHLEELQQEIEIYLKVENDGEKGSLVSCSWE